MPAADDIPADWLAEFEAGVCGRAAHRRLTMPRLSRLRGREVIAALRRAGFVVLRIKGSHHFLQHPDGWRTVVSVPVGEIIGPGLLNQILKDAEVEADEFQNGLQVAVSRCARAAQAFSSFRLRLEA